MKIITWNCNCKFREKFKIITSYDADIYVIQECENPLKTSSEDYKKFAENSLWVGNNKNKGLGIFAKKAVDLEQLFWNSNEMNYFLPCSVNNQINLIGVWAMFPYTSLCLSYYRQNKDKFGKNTVFIGDFNSNAKWDSTYSAGAYGELISNLSNSHMVSAYHMLYEEEHGSESNPTFYMYRNENKPYHMDYCFCNEGIIKSLSIGWYFDWIKYSDHMPLCLEINI